jgi:hypothetical protein
MTEEVKYSYPLSIECFRKVVREKELTSIVVARSRRCSSVVSRYLKTVEKARRAVRDSKLVFKG